MGPTGSLPSLSSVTLPANFSRRARTSKTPSPSSRTKRDLPTRAPLMSPASSNCFSSRARVTGWPLINGASIRLIAGSSSPITSMRSTTPSSMATCNTPNSSDCGSIHEVARMKPRLCARSAIAPDNSVSSAPVKSRALKRSMMSAKSAGPIATRPRMAIALT